MLMLIHCKKYYYFNFFPLQRRGSRAGLVRPGVIVIKTFLFINDGVKNKLECLSRVFFQVRLISGSTARANPSQLLHSMGRLLRTYLQHVVVFVTNEWAQLFRVFVRGRPFQPKLLFLGEARCLP
jgi:hypothetical protein